MTSPLPPVAAVALEFEDDLLTQLLVDAPPALAALAVPGLLMYASFWALARRWMAGSRVLGTLALGGFWGWGAAVAVSEPTEWNGY